MATMFPSTPTCVGVADADSEPVPSCPLEPSPHAQTFPYSSSASEWFSPAAMRMTLVGIPRTFCGLVLTGFADPSPS